MHLELQKYLVPLLNAAILGTISDFEINQLVKIAQRYASIRLTQLIKKGKLSTEVVPHSIKVVALDCIAEIFKRDQNGNFVELSLYFSNEKSIHSVEPEITLINFRSLVFSKLTDGIFRLYREYDPITSKILRNIKLICKNESEVMLFERFGEIMISNAGEALNEHLPEYPFDELETALTINSIDSQSTKKILISILDNIKNNSCYRKYYPLTDVALLMKFIYLRNREFISDKTLNDSDLIFDDVKNIIKNSFDEFKIEMSDKYLVKKKIDEDSFLQYLNAIEKYLYSRFLLNNGNKLTYFEYLQEQNNELTYEKYRSFDRIKFEYMLKVAKSKVIANLKVAFN